MPFLFPFALGAAAAVAATKLFKDGLNSQAAQDYEARLRDTALRGIDKIQEAAKTGVDKLQEAADKVQEIAHGEKVQEAAGKIQEVAGKAKDKVATLGKQAE
jgi:uncharacterized protein YjbJ (UPF0337 family)